jgi:hypothetical protein
MLCIAQPIVIATGRRGCTSFVLDPACRQAGFLLLFLSRKKEERKRKKIEEKILKHCLE